MAKKMTEAQAEAYKARRWRDIEYIAETLWLYKMHYGKPKHQIDKQMRKLIDRCAAYKRDYG